MLDLFPSQPPSISISPFSVRYQMIMHYGFVAQANTYRPYWILVDSSGATPKQTKHILQAGQQLAFQYSAERYCTGRYDLLADGLSLSPCPHQAKLPPTRPAPQCFACDKARGFHPAFDTLPAAALSPQQQQYNRFPHDVYLAYFAPGVIKVGISCQPRLKKRWLEQGARAACLLQAMPDAYQARALEKKVVALGLLERVYTKQKKQWLLHCPFDQTKANLQLAQKSANICQALQLKTPNSAVLDFESIYWPTPPPPLAAMATMTSIYGQRWFFHTMIGDIVVLYNGKIYTLVALKAVLGQLKVAIQESACST